MSAIFTVQSDLPKLIASLERLYPDKWREILADATTETGYYVLNKYKQQLPKYIDRPTPYTINSMYLKPARPNRLEASVQWKDNDRAAGHYLKPEVTGGPRPDKRFETALKIASFMPDGYFAVPTDDVHLDAFGNVPRGTFIKILSGLRANFDPYQNRGKDRGYRGKSDSFIKKYRGDAPGFVDRARARAKDQRSQQRAAKYFAVLPGGRGGLYPGIYESLVLFGGRGSRRLFSFVRDVVYKKQIPFEQIGADAAAKKFPEKLREAIDKVTK